MLLSNFIKNPMKCKSFLHIINSQISKYSTIMENKVEINGQTLNYIKSGNGKHQVICLPGALGTIWSDFKPQIENLDKNKFTIIAWDPPGYGKSRPPNRNFTPELYETDGDFADQLMQYLNIDKYSILGWSDGGMTGMFMAAKYPKNVNKLVIWGSNSYIKPEELESYEKMRDISKWSDRMKAPLIEMYGEQGLKDLWDGWCDAMVAICKRDGNVCKHVLEKIKCPTFILHGDKDPMVLPEHPTYLLSKIKGSKLYNFPDGKHNIHLRYAEEFNKLVTEFLEQ